MDLASQRCDVQRGAAYDMDEKRPVLPHEECCSRDGFPFEEAPVAVEYDAAYRAFIELFEVGKCFFLESADSVGEMS